MESGAEFSASQYTATFRVAEEIRAAKKQRNHLWTEAKFPKLKEYLANIRYPYLRGQCDESCLELGFDPVPKQIVFNILRRIGRKLITYENVFSVNKSSLPSDIQVKYVEDNIIKRDTSNLGMSSKEVIQVISEIGQEKLSV